MQNDERQTSNRKDKKPLTRKAALFASEFLIDLNGTQAAIRAGYAPKRADQMAYELLRKPEIIAAIAKRRKELQEKLEVTQERVILEYARIAFSDIGNYTEWDNGSVRLKDSGELDENQRRAMSEVSQTVTKDGGTVRFKLHDKVSALDALGKHLGMFPREVKHSGSIEHILPQPSGMTIEELREARDALKELKAAHVEGSFTELPSGEAADD